MDPHKPTSLPRRHFMTSMVRSEESMTMKNNQEEILDALTDFERRPSKEIPPVLEQFLRDVAQTGETLFPWSRVKVLFKWKLEQVMAEFNEDSPIDHLPTFPNVENVKFEEYRRRILAAVEKFHGVPFTIQRLCELITEPKKHYKKSDKFLRGIEKNVLVVSTVDPMGRREVSESKILVNGLDTNGCSPKADRSGEEDHAVPEIHAMVDVPAESSDNVSTKWPMSIPAISVPGPSLFTASSSMSSITTTTPSTQQSSPAPAAAQAEEEKEAKAESASNGLHPEEEEMEDREAVSGETDSQSSSSDDSLPSAPADASEASELPSSNSEAEESHPAGCQGHSDQDSSITTSDGAGEVSMQWPGHSMTVNNSAEASACPPSSSPPQASACPPSSSPPQASGPSSEVTISTSNSTSPSSDPDLPLSDKSNNAESEAEARSTSPLGEEEREDSSQEECTDECGPAQQQQCEVDSSESTERESDGQDSLTAEELACQASNSDLTDSAGAEVSVSSSELAEQAEHSAQAPSSAEDTEAEAPVEMEQEKEEQQEEERQQEPTQSEEEPMEQD